MQNISEHGEWRLYAKNDETGQWVRQPRATADLAEALERILRWRSQGQDVRLEWVNCAGDPLDD